MNMLEYIKKNAGEYLNTNNLGLILSILGTLLIAFTLTTLPCARQGSLDGGVTSCTTKGSEIRDYRIVYYVHPQGFKLGIILLLAGFALQIKKSQKAKLI